MFRSSLALALLSLASADPYSCHDDAIELNATNTKFLLNQTEMAPGQQCHWNFTIPSNKVAQISINGSSMLISDSVQVFSQWGPNNVQSLGIQGVDNTTIDKNLLVMWPPVFFEMTIVTGQNTSASLAISVILHDLDVKSASVTKYTTAVNQQPAFVQFKYSAGWQPYSCVQATASSGGKVTVSMNNPGPWDYVTYSNVFVYSGNKSNLVFLGTLNSLILGAFDDYYTSPNDTLTLYKSMETYVTAYLIINDHDNMKSLSSFDTDWSPYTWPDRNYQSSIYLDATLGPAALTVLNEPDGSNAIYLERIDNVNCTSCPVPNNYTSPIKVIAGGVIQDYNNQTLLLGTYRDPSIFDDCNYPQYLPGTARTFILEQGIAIIHYSSVDSAVDTVPVNGRNGFVMTDNYPFRNLNQNSQNLTLYSLDGSNFTLEYTITAPISAGYLNLYLTYNNKTSSNQKSITGIAPGSYNVTAEGIGMRVINGPATGIFIPFRVYSPWDSVPTNGTTPSTAVTSASSTVTTTKATTTTTASNITSTTSGSTVTTTKPATPSTTSSPESTPPTPVPVTNGTTPSTNITSIPSTKTTGRTETTEAPTTVKPATITQSSQTTGSQTPAGTSTTLSPSATASVASTTAQMKTTVTSENTTPERNVTLPTVPTTPSTTTPKAGYRSFGLTALTMSLIFLLL